MSEEYIPQEPVGKAVIRELFDWVEAAMVAVVAVVLIFTFMIRMAGVDGTSMNPTLEHKDRLLITRMFYKPTRGDIVVVTKPNSRGEPLVKRVIATEGETIDIDFEEGTVTVNGRLLDEPYIAEPTYTGYDLEFPLTVPEGCVFIMGDNRNASWDSRSSGVGMVDERYILGKVVYRVLPYNQMGVPK